MVKSDSKKDRLAKLGEVVRKDCPKCGKKGQVFYSKSHPYCKVCFRNYQRIQHHVKKWKPGLLKKQKGRCKICRVDLRKLPTSQHHVDHLHDTGLVRGLLCKSCNNALGNMRDNPDRLEAAAAYLRETEPFDPRVG